MLPFVDITVNFQLAAAVQTMSLTYTFREVKNVSVLIALTFSKQ